MTSPQIFLAIKFKEIEDAVLQYDSMHIAACSNSEAFNEIYKEGIDTKNLFITNNDGRIRDKAIRYIFKCDSTAQMTKKEFEDWKRVALCTRFSDNMHLPPSWICVPKKPL